MKIVFMGTPQAAVPSLKKILENGHQVVGVWTQPDRPAGRGNRLTPPPVKEFALVEGLEVFQPQKIKTVESLELFRSHRADVAVVVAYGRILPQTFLEAFPEGAINVHFSILPKYRGAAPVNWAIVRGERETGVTTMKMDAGLDTGDILLQSQTPIAEDENAVELMERLSVLGADLLAKTLAELDEIEPVAQDHEKATLAPILKKEDGLINWGLTAFEINNRVRGFQPFPKSFSVFEGQKLTVWRSSVEKEKDRVPDKKPGEIISATGDSLLVVCGDGSILKILELQIEGKRRMATRDFLNGVKIKAGDFLGV
ncbi:MAG: methionyl-tRNA formyltransferase [Pyrinomonadaceae bacterium]